MEGQLLILTFGGAIISFVFFLIALAKIAKSPMTDAVKLGWVITILFLPIIGSFCALVVVRKY